MLLQIARAPRWIAGVTPPTVRHSVPTYSSASGVTDLRPRYRAAVAAAEAPGRDRPPVAELPALVDRLAGLAGEYFASIAALSGAAYKLEMNLARFWRRHVAGLVRRQPPAAPRPGSHGRPMRRDVLRRSRRWTGGLAPQVADPARLDRRPIYARLGRGEGGGG